MNMKWYKYKMLTATKHHGTRTHNYDAMSDKDAIGRGAIKRLKIEDEFSDVVAYQIESIRSGEIISKNVYLTILDDI